MKADLLLEIIEGSEKKTITSGIFNALKKGMNVKLKCNNCGLEIPPYKGRYPSRCPNCNSELVDPNDVNQDKISEPEKKDDLLGVEGLELVSKAVE